MGLEEFNVRPEVLARIKTVLSDSSYREIVESSSQYNNGIVGERKQRLPYLDSQTGVAQSDCCLWMHRTDRMPGQNVGQLYSYPAKRWKKKRRQYLINEEYVQKARQQQQQQQQDANEVESQAVATESTVKPENNDSTDKFFENSKDTWYGDYDDGSDLPDAGELDDPESDFDDYEEYGSKKKKRKKGESSSKRKRVEYSDAEKPYACDLCGARYKTRPGLSYHYSHSHQNDGGSRDGTEKEEEMPYSLPSRPVHSNGPSSSRSEMNHGPPPASQPPPLIHANMPPRLPGQLQMAPSGPGQRESPIPHNMPPAINNNSAPANPAKESRPENNEAFEGNRPNSKKPAASPSQYCDFCLGDSVENKKTKSAESLVSCSDCGRSAHPTCLQFTPNMIASVKKYRWQCIECKSCGLCGTSDNDDQLLFCDDCDRGYHMYCLKPPLSEPPEGSWSCHLCIVEYHTPKSK
ncbi:Zinc finger protein ubi-d4 [Halotydeus destructor]|nr:Zinc finger protein ubi-d4 [Halotydeus destructor]